MLHSVEIVEVVEDIGLVSQHRGKEIAALDAAFNGSQQVVALGVENGGFLDTGSASSLVQADGGVVDDDGRIQGQDVQCELFGGSKLVHGAEEVGA